MRLDARFLRRHAEVVDAARRTGVDVYVEPLTERYSVVGFKADAVPYAPALGSAIDRCRLVPPGAQASFVDEDLAIQRDVASALTPPHFFVDSEAGLALNVALVRQALALDGADRLIRPILAVGSQYLRLNAERISSVYRATGIVGLELRVSPLGGDEIGPLTIRRLRTAALVASVASPFAASGDKPLSVSASRRKLPRQPLEW